MDRTKQTVQQGIPVTSLDAAHANQYFEQFVNATSLKNILGYYRGLIDNLHLRPNYFTLFYPKLKANLTSWRAKALLKKFDSRASHKCYQKGKLASNTRVLVIGGGPCGLRTAIEAQLLGAKVVVVEKRDRFSRNNVLHLWPFVIEDLRMLGAKKFFGKFCAGAIDHISIRQLQCILLKVALLLGVEIHTEVSFEELIEPNAAEKIGWRAQFKPSNHPVSQYEFDVIIGADGKRNTLQGFTRKEFRGKLAIAITANFINKKTEAEARVEEISGVAFIFNQKFFKDLQESTRIDLENIVYYKDDTHYFVMTAKKHSLIEKGVIKQDFPDTERLLASENVDKDALQQYAIEAASFSTNYQMPNLEFAVNHYGQPDIAMFDFTSMYVAENASKVVERSGYRLLKILVGDSLLEPFWPTGSGCARGFLSALDAAWAIRSWSLGTVSPLDVLAERESIYRLLAQTTPDNLNKDWKSYTLDPSTRYPNLNKAVVLPHQVISLYDTDNPASIERMKRSSTERTNEVPKKRRRGIVDNEVLLNWLVEQLKDKEEVDFTDIGSVFKSGKVLCAIIHRYRPDLLDVSAIKNNDAGKNNQIAIDILEKDLGILPVMTGTELTVTEDYLTMASYLTEIYDCFRGEIPYIKHPKLKRKSAKSRLIPNTKINLSSYFSEFYNKNTDTPCKKCFSAYNSVMSFNSRSGMGKLTIPKTKSVACQVDEIPLITGNHVELMFKTNSRKKIYKKADIQQASKVFFYSKSAISKYTSHNKIAIETVPFKKLQPISKDLHVTFSESLQETINIYESDQQKCNSKKCSKDSSTFKKTTSQLSNTKIQSHTRDQKSKNALSNNQNIKKQNNSDTLKELCSEYDDFTKSNSSHIYAVNHSQITESTQNLVITPEEIQRKCIERIYKKHRKLKNFLLKSLKNKSSKLLKEHKNAVILPIINDETEQINLNLDDKLTENNVQQEQISNLILKNIGTNTTEQVINEVKGHTLSDNKIEFAEDDRISQLNKTVIGDDNLSTKSHSENEIQIRFLDKSDNKYTLQTFYYTSSLNQLIISSKVSVREIPNKSILNQDNFVENKIFYPPGNRDSDLSKKLNCHDSNDIFFNRTCRFGNTVNKKFTSINRKMFNLHSMSIENYSRVVKWLSSNDFFCKDTIIGDNEGSLISKTTDITSVSKIDEYKDVFVEKRTNILKLGRTSRTPFKLKKLRNLKPIKNLSKFSQYSPFQYYENLKSTSAPPSQFSVIIEGEESELPLGSTKLTEVSYKTIKTAGVPSPSVQISVHSNRNKHKHNDSHAQRLSNIDKKPKKRRSMEKIGVDRQKVLDDITSNRMERQNRRRYQRKLQTEQFLKSMQMLQANAKPDSQPFEDYSIFLYRQTAPKFKDRVKDLEKQFTYVPDHENKPSHVSRTSGRDEDIAAKIKHLENKWRQPEQVDKKPKDLMRAIGKIETTDWNIKEIEKKILENKLGKPSKPNDREKVPKWSKEQFVARQTKMEKQHIDRQNSAEAKFAEIDRSIKNLDQKIKEGTVRELGQNKVASITEKLVGKIQTEPKPVEKNITRQPLPALPTQNASEFCHFCNKRVYLMERLSAEGRFFHHSCFKCQYCHVQLRLGSYTFDRDGLYGHRFFCLQHFGMLGESPSARVVRKHSIKRQNDLRKSPEKKPLPGIAGVDLLDKVQTPERIEFANLSTGNISSDQEDSLNQIDEDEWTDKNFGASCAELDDTDDDSSSISYSDSEDEDAYDDALEEPATKEGTLKWAERWKNSYSRRKNNSDSNEYSSSDQSSYYDSSDDDESETATEGEEEIRARELRKQEVCVEPPIVHTDTGTDTEIVSDETSSESSSEVHNSATEISTDSEFAQDDPTPTREIPSILLNDFNVTKTRGSGGNYPKKIQVTSRYLQRPSNGKTKKPNIDLKLTPLVPSALSVKKTAPVTLSRPTGYVLNRTQSTGGIAAKVSLELKKKYLLGEPNPGSIQKSGSASTLDTKFKSFHTNISDCQKLLKPSTEISASMQTFCKKLNELQSPVQSSPTIFTKHNAPTESTNTKEIQNISVEEQHTNDVKPEKIFENESEGRPRSPLHETSIIVPQIDWNKQNNILTSDSLASSESDNEANKKRKQFENKPRVEICTEYLNEHTQEDKDEFVPDSLVCVNKETVEIPSNDPPKSITSEKKTLNQPKPLPNLENLLPEIHNSLHIKYKNLDNFSKEVSSTKVHSSGVSSPESLVEQVTTALTETELSDWARDEVVSDDFEDEEYESNVKYTNKPVKMADLLEFDESVSKKSTEIPLKDKIVLTEAVNNVLSINLDNIEFMDTGTETSSDDGVANSQNGYVLFKNEDDFAEDSLNPHINDISEATNIHVLSLSKDNKEIPDSDVTQQTQNTVNNDLDDDSVVIIESGTTTEENTLTDSTVKNVTEFDKKSPNNNKTTETETTPVNEFKSENAENIDNSIEFQKHCERLKSKVEFSNVKDSIDIRNCRRKSKPDILYTPDLITEEVSSTTTSKNVSLNLSSAHHTPDILYNKEVIKKERDINQKLIQEMVMNKMKAENKSLERRKRNKMSPSIKSPSDLTKSATATNVLCTYKSIQNTSNKALFSSPFDQPDVLLSTNYPLQNSKSANIDFISSEITYTTPPSVGLKPTPIQKTPDNSDIPKPPPRYNKTPEEMNRKLEKLKQQVRLRNKENEHLLLNRHKFENNQRKEAPLRRCVSGNYESALFSSTAAHDSYSSRAKSTPDFPNKLMAVHPIIIDKDRKKIYKSDPNILELDGNKNKPKSQDREQRKSLTKLLTGLFSKKSPSSKGLFSKLSPKSKEVSKDPLIYNDRKSLSESYIARNLTPPPIPPLPVNYVKKADDSSDDDGLKKRNDSSCDTLDFTGASIGSVSVRKSTKSRRTSRQAQLKRHRMAQEIQRKLEETEVKMKELENRGVSVEKALRGEDNSYKDEPELLQEWFDLMRDRTELRRYEKELSVRAQELELEDRHARLQYELRERIEDDKPKTKEDLEVEESIINEMIKIVEKRDSLLTEIEEDRLRYSHEDRDLEEQMLAKGLRLTSIKNSPE